MKKRIYKYNKKKNRVLNKLGMTYVELLCALSLLSLIVVMFTPMLLSSYENLYKAGEKVEEVYDSKEELEEGLATRFSEKTVVFNTFNLGLNDLKNNADLLFEAINVNGKKIVSSLQQGLETVFGNARASVDIISPRTVYDDKSNHDVMIQTTGIEYSKVFYGSYTSKYGTNQETADAAFLSEHKANIADGGEGIIFIEVIIPDKTVSSEGASTDDESVYLAKNIATLQMYTVEDLNVKNPTSSSSGNFDMLNTDNYGRIKFNVSGRTGTPLDFTQSPIKINVYYVNPREQVKEVSDYLIIDPPTMMFAGDTSSTADYYTSAGVQEKDGVYTLEVEARKMRLTNSGYLTASDAPSAKGVRIQTISWVQEDENDKIRPYYVMAGTNSSVYRMYNFRKATSINEVFGITGAKSTNEGSFIRADGSLANPSFWSGEMSDQYYFKTLTHSSGYGAGEYVGVDGSAKQSGSYQGGSRNHHGSRYDYFDKTLRYSMSFNGFSTGYDYQHLANRRISYVLTEVGAGRSFRFGGRLRDGEFSDYSMPWEPAGTYYQGGGKKVNAILGIGGQIIAPANESKPDDDNPYEGPVYFEAFESILGGSENLHFDRHFAYVRLKSYVSVDPIAATSANNADFKDRFNKGDFWWPYGYNEDNEGSNAITAQYANDWDWLSQDTANCVSVESSAYLPGAGSNGQGQVIYFGTVPAYAFIEQSSDIGTNEEPEARNVYNGKNIKSSRQTGYVVSGGQGNGANSTLIYRYFNIKEANIDSVSDYFVALCQGTGGALQEENNRNTFYTYGQSDKALYYEDFDLRFTFGYCSRWRMAIGDVTYNGANESPRSYEKYYTASNPTSSYKLGTRTDGSDMYSINNRGEDNLYYNVWFPGEYYNLTDVATRDEVTIAVGYAVSGSTFMKESAAWGSYGASGGFYGTALGSIYNDGVMAAYVSEDAGGKVNTEGLSGKGERNTIFQNVLYYKMHSFINTDECPWYLHARDSVRFTAVDLVEFTTEPDSTGTSTKMYIAVYGDSNGKAYYSIVATSTVKNTTGGEGEGKESDVVLRSGNNPLNASEMYEIKVDGNSMTNGVAMDEIFSEITNIDASDDMVVITGIAKAGEYEQLVVLERPDPSRNEWKGKRIYNGTFTGLINNAMFLGDYYYIVGDGWIAGVSLDALKSTPHNGTIVSSKTVNTTTNKNELIWCETDVNNKQIGNIYALDGRLTEG